MISIKIQNHYKALREVNAFIKSIDKKVNTLLERLMDEGFKVASDAFQVARYAGTNDVDVKPPYWDGDDLVLMAIGESVWFIEFGSGTFYEEYPDPSVYTKLGMSKRGEYGQKKGAHPPWRYIGDAGNSGVVLKHKSDGTDVVQTYGNPPARAMFQATEAIANRERILQIAKEIFNND